MCWALGCGRPPPRCAQSTQHSHRHSTDREQVRIQSETSGSPCGLCVMQFDVPNLHNSYLKFSIQAAVRLVPPLPAGYRYLGMCAACVCYGATGRRRSTRTGHACGDANDTTEPPPIAYTSYSIIHIMPARKLVCVLRVYMYGVWHADGMRDRQTGHGGGATLCVLLPRPRPADLAGRCGIPETRDNDGVSRKAFSCA